MVGYFNIIELLFKIYTIISCELLLRINVFLLNNRPRFCNQLFRLYRFGFGASVIRNERTYLLRHI